MKEFEPKVENKLPRCANPECGKIVDITDYQIGYCRQGDDYFHLDHFKIKDKAIRLQVPETIIFREPEMPLESPNEFLRRIIEEQEDIEPYKEGDPIEEDELPDVEIYHETTFEHSMSDYNRRWPTIEAKNKKGRSKFSANESKAWLEKRDEREKKRSEGQSKKI